VSEKHGITKRLIFINETINEMIINEMINETIDEMFINEMTIN